MPKRRFAAAVCMLLAAGCGSSGVSPVSLPNGGIPPASTPGSKLNGKLYGTTYMGGANNNGIVYSISP